MGIKTGPKRIDEFSIFKIIKFYQAQVLKFESI